MGQMGEPEIYHVPLWVDFGGGSRERTVPDLGRAAETR